jgi:hypothetical protein
MDEQVQELGEAAMNRDPRKAPFGFYSGGSFVMDSSRVFSWFESVDELAAFLLDVEPLIYDMDDPDELAAHKAKVFPILAKLKISGFNDGLREEINAAISEFAVIDWWGNFSEITAGKTEFSQNLMENFVDPEDGQDLTVPADQMDDFVEYLLTCGC